MKTPPFYLFIMFIAQLSTTVAQQSVFGQYKLPVFTKQDTLKGSITPERSWWDVVYYHLDVAVNPSDSSIKGSNTIVYKVLNSGGVMQIDLQEPMKIIRIVQNAKDLAFEREGNVYWVRMSDNQIIGNINLVIVNELDEMHTYVGSKKTTDGYGLLLIDIENGLSRQVNKNRISFMG